MGRLTEQTSLTSYVCSEDRFTNIIMVAAEDFSLSQAITLSLSVSPPQHGEHSLGTQQTNVTDPHYGGPGKSVIRFRASVSSGTGITELSWVLFHMLCDSHRVGKSSHCELVTRANTPAVCSALLAPVPHHWLTRPPSYRVGIFRFPHFS